MIPRLRSDGNGSSLSPNFVGISLRAGKTGETPFGELVHTAVQNLGFVTVERFPFGKEPTEAFGCNHELSYFFLDQQSDLSP